METKIRLVDYFYVQVPDRAGEGAKILGAIRDAGVNLLAVSGFPEGRKSQIDLVPEDATRFKALAKKSGWKVTGPKKAFWIYGGADRPGIVASLADKLAAAGVQITAATIACSGGSRFGGILWVPPDQVKKAAKALGAEVTAGPPLDPVESPAPI